MSEDVTELLKAWAQGDQNALKRLTPLVYRELLKISSDYLRWERVDHTLETAGLVNEAFVRLASGKRVDWQDRQHFFKIASQQMRRILIDYAKARKRQKRPTQRQRELLPTDMLLSISTLDPADLIALDRALNALKAFDRRKAEIVELRFFGGLRIEEIKESVGLSKATVNRELQIARRWLAREIQQG